MCAWKGFAAVLAATLLRQPAAAAQEPLALPPADELYERLVTLDAAILFRPSALELEVCEEYSPLNPECGDVTWTVHVTTDGDSWAGEKVQPRYAVVTPEGDRRFSLRSPWQRNEDGTVEWVRTAHERILQTPELYRSSMDTVYQKYAADGSLLVEAVQNSPTRQECRVSPGTRTPLAEWLLATGRGFSPLLQSIDQVQEEDGLLAVSATGRWWSREGRWLLLLDPDAQLLARRAQFEGFRLRFEGEVPTAAGPLAASCRRTDAMGPLARRQEPWRATVRSYRPATDTDLLRRLTDELGSE